MKREPRTKTPPLIERILPMLPIRISIAALLIKPLNFSIKREQEQKEVINGSCGYMSAARVAPARKQKHAKGEKTKSKLSLVRFLRVIRSKRRKICVLSWV